MEFLPDIYILFFLKFFSGILPFKIFFWNFYQIYIIFFEIFTRYIYIFFLKFFSGILPFKKFFLEFLPDIYILFFLKFFSGILPFKKFFLEFFFTHITIYKKNSSEMAIYFFWLLAFWNTKFSFVFLFLNFFQVYFTRYIYIIFFEIFPGIFYHLNFFLEFFSRILPFTKKIRAKWQFHAIEANRNTKFSFVFLFLYFFLVFSGKSKSIDRFLFWNYFQANLIFIKISIYKMKFLKIYFFWLFSCNWSILKYEVQLRISIFKFFYMQIKKNKKVLKGG